jgi:hypothetical protein
VDHKHIHDASPVPAFSRVLTESKRPKSVIRRRHYGELQVIDSIAAPAATEPFAPRREAAGAPFCGFWKNAEVQLFNVAAGSVSISGFDINHIRGALTMG